ncbi:hypothetical protein EsH8_VI_000679 [Colletotrichum jinshuiense]
MAFYPNYQTTYDYAAFSTPFPGNTYQNDYTLEMYRQHAAMMSRGMFPASGGKATESKPRLAKDEVDKLEREFQRNNKPNSSLKKQLAEEMRVDIARINNWFQNRRAKAKQEKRAQENEARRKSEQAAETTTSSETVKEYFNDHDDDDLRPSTAPFPLAHVSTETPSVRESSPAEGTESPEHSAEKPKAVVEESGSEYASPDSSGFQHHDIDISYALAADQFFSDQSSCDFSSSMASETAHQVPGHLTLTIPNQFMSHFPESMSDSSFPSYHQLSSASVVENALASMPHVLPSNLSDPVQINIKEEQMQGEDLDKFDELSPKSMAHSPPEIATPDFRFKSSSAIDIASRRNSKRPAQLVSCMRSQSYNYSGPKTGIEMPRRIEAPSPMRRVASATGNFPRGIQKTSSAGPRSPLYFDRNQENLLLQMAARSPISRSSAAPPTPNTPIVPTQQAMREATVSSMSSDEDKSYSLQTNLTVPQYAMDPTMRTPPDTPGIMTSMPNALFPTFDFNVPDDPLPTPSFGGFDQEFPAMSTNIPSYVAHSCASQPVTPSFPPSNMGPAFYSSYGGGNTEYNWSDASAVSAKPSPEQSRSRQFQFTNMTAQDFHGE